MSASNDLMVREAHERKQQFDDKREAHERKQRFDGAKHAHLGFIWGISIKACWEHASLHF